MGKKKKKPRPDPSTLGLPRVGVETHAHLNLERFDHDRDQVLQRAADAGVARIVNVFLGPRPYLDDRHLFDDHPEVSFICGLHPNDRLQAPLTRDLALMEEAFSADDRLLAVGEIGLDFYWDDVPPQRQAEVFTAQLSLARRLHRPVVIHCRDAEKQTVSTLLDAGFRGYPLLWHCFGGDTVFASHLIDQGWLLSIPGPVTYPKNHDLRRAVADLPADRFVLETDCPFLTPQQWRGKRNEPAFVAFTAAAVAEARGEPAAELWQRCGETARRFFGM